MTTTSTDHQAAQDATGSGGLRLHDVSLTLGDGDTAVTALDHVELTVAPGEFVAVVPASPACSPSPEDSSGPPRAPSTSPAPS